MTDLRISLNRITSHYLGDGVYIQPSDAEQDAYWLITHNGFEVVEQIYLEADVLQDLHHYIWKKAP